MSGQTFTLTFCECAENHVGMEKIGQELNPGDGFTIDDLQTIYNNFIGNAEYHRLDVLKDREPAGLLIIKNGLSLLGIDDNQLFLEQFNLTKDTKFLNKGRVCNKLARHNLCFADYDQSPSYEEGKGTVINFNHLPLTNLLRDRLKYIGGNKAINMLAEGNYYYDINKCGIGWHGDSERKRIIGVRLGSSMPLCLRWYKNSQHDEDIHKFIINSGDIYIFSEKASGNDWKKRSIWTLRHSAGCDKYIS